MQILNPIPFREAIVQLAQKALLPTNMNSAELMQLDASVRERAFFSARNMYEVVLSGIRDKVATLINPQTVPRGATEGETLARARTDIREMLQSVGYDPDKPGTITDISSDQRIRLVLDMNMQMAQNYGDWRQGQTKTLLDAYPAQELYRAEERKEKRDWYARWEGAGGEIFPGVPPGLPIGDGNGRMIALKNDTIWSAISEFGLPYPPFDFNSGMSIRDVSRLKAMAFGLIDADTEIEPQRRPFEDSFPT